jgi:hypothetical protein
MQKNILSFIVMVLYGLSVNTQEVVGQDSLQLKIVSRYIGEGKTKIRIFPNNYAQTKALILSGLKVTVQPVATKENFINAATRTYNFDTTSIEVWRQNITDQNLAVLAQLAYGKLENVTDIFAVKAQQENLFTVSMMASSLSWKAASISHLGIELALNTDTVYAVSISLLHPSKLIKNSVNRFSVMSDNKKYQFNTVNVINEEHLVKLNWGLNEDFILYDIEKSISKNGDFKKLNRIPFTVTDKDTSRTQIVPNVSYNDTLVANYVKNYYRVVAYDYFGERIVSPEVYEGMGVDKTAPRSLDSLWFSSNGERHVLLQWKKSPDPDLSQQIIYHGFSPEGPWRALKKLSAIERSFTDDSASNILSNYYRIALFDSVNNNVYSLPVMAVTKDTVPPIAAKELKGTIEKSGIVRLNWIPSPSEDIEGYRIYRSKTDSSEWQSIMGESIRESYYVDTLNIKINQGEIRYSLRAVDRKGNFGEFTNSSKLNIPDIIPPAQPQIIDITPVEDGSLSIQITYNKTELQSTIEIRRAVNGDTSTWKSFDGTQAYQDSSVSRKNIYAYQVRVIDSAQNASTPSEWVSQRPLPKPIKIEDIMDWSLDYDKNGKQVNLKWILKKECEQCKIFIYRGEEKLFLIANKNIKDGIFIDKGFPPAGYVNYQIQLKGMNDEKSSLSPSKTVFTQ